MSEPAQSALQAIDRNPARPLEFVVGFDGSPSSRRALELAGLLADVRDAHVSVVYVAHLPGVDSLAPQVVVPARDNQDEIATALDGAATSILTPFGSPWRFVRRDGDIAHELLAAAEDLEISDDGVPRRVVIVVGASDQRRDRWLGSVSRRLTRQNRIALAVVPSDADADADLA